MGGVKLVLRNDCRNADLLAFPMPDEPYRSRLKEVLDRCWEKSNGFVSITIERPYKPRTTGEKSQNNKFYALVTQIAKETGNDIEDVKNGVKERAIKRGYPYSINPISKSIQPYSTTKVNTVEMSYLIEECIQVCAELGIVIDVPDEPAVEKPRPVYPVKTEELANEALRYADDDDVSEGDLF